MTCSVLSRNRRSTLVSMAFVSFLILSTAAAAQQSSPSDTKQASTEDASAKIYKDGSIRDINAIGNRNVGCEKGVGNWYSLDKQVAMGKTFAQQVESQAKLIQDPVVTEYVNRLGQNLVRNSDAKVPFTIKVIDAEDINAFALPGGFFFVNSGLIMNADNEAELAGVMSHEIAHVAACHAAREQTRGELANLASIPLIFVGGGLGYAAYSAMGIAVPIGFMKFSRGFEAQADYLGLEYMYKAGYDPQAFIAFFEKIQAQEKQKPGTIAKVFSTHPETPDRIEHSQDEIEHILPARDQYILDTSEFEDVKARLAAELNKRHFRDRNNDANRPTLRRADSSHPTTDTGANSGDKTDNANNSDDGRPTLKRRDPNGG
jgi:predicted Zn-dependent protease